jgi:hypothetical protein
MAVKFNSKNAQPLITKKPISRRNLLKKTAKVGAGLVLANINLNFLISGVEAKSYNYTSPTDPVIFWNKVCLVIISGTKSAPPVSARALAILHTCIYDAWTVYDPVAISTIFGDLDRRPKSEHTLENKQTAICYTAYRALADLFPTETAFLGQIMSNLGYDPCDNSNDSSSPVGVGNICAKAVLSFRHGDGSNQKGDLHIGAYSDYTGYSPLNPPDQMLDVNYWQPLIGADGKPQQFLTPHWGMLTPFALSSGLEFRLAPPHLYPSTNFNDQLEEVINISANLTEREKLIAEYWADDAGTVTPPGHWCQIAQYLAERDKYNLDSNVKLFFALTNALLDASIAVWETKRFYDSTRPITAIHHLYANQFITSWGGVRKGTQTILGSQWKPYISTPPFGEYVSGHSTFSASSTEILKLFSGSDYYGASQVFPAGSSLIEPDFTPNEEVTLSWDTFSQASEEAGISRLYGGIHFMAANLEGRSLGKKVAAKVWQKAEKLWSGST